MSDFDAVLERVLSDPGFTAALAADPATALAGYRLSDDERGLLFAQVSTDSGGDRQVERRTSKASLFGLLSPLAGAAGLTHDPGIGHAVGAAASAHAGVGATDTQGFGPAGGTQGFGPAGGTQGFGPADTQGFGPAGGPGAGSTGLDGLVVDTGGTANTSGGLLGHGITELPGQAPGQAPPPDYHPHVDVDGDGRWDQYTVQTRGDGGLDVVADMDHDGHADFVGHDDNRDGIIDRADYDADHDGRFEKHLRDVDGDGWMDRTTIDPR
jgi:hypothetical protein